MDSAGLEVNMQKICKIEICDRISRANDYCNAHNERLRITSSLFENIPIRKREKHKKLCAVEGCGRKHKSKGYCSAHSKRLKYWGELKEDIPLRDHLSVGCIIENCDSPKKALNLCNKHYEKLKKYGDPSAGKEANKGYIGKRYIDKYGYAFVMFRSKINGQNVCMSVNTD